MTFSFGRVDILREIHYMTQRAQAEDARLVGLGKLVLFSTKTRDAWLLDIEDDLALPVCLDGEPLTRATRAQEKVQDHLHQWQAKTRAARAIDGRLARG